MQPADPPTRSVWLITGCSSGFGAEIARQVLASGHSAVVTARNPETLRHFHDQHGGRALCLALDVTRPDHIASAVDAAEATFGCIDVLCNNAGAAYLSSVEEADDARVRDIFESNFFGPTALLRAVLPGMRARRSGRILNFSSIGGLAAFAASGYYAASKFAIEGISEALAQEVAPLGIAVTLIEPGPFRTGMAKRAKHETRCHPDYEPTVLTRERQMRETGEQWPGDPVRGAAAVLKVAELANPPLRLILGSAALPVARGRFEAVLRNIEDWRELSTSCDYPPG